MDFDANQLLSFRVRASRMTLDELKADLESVSSRFNDIQEELKGGIVAYLNSEETREFIETEGTNTWGNTHLQVVRSAIMKKGGDHLYFRSRNFGYLRGTHRSYFHNEGMLMR